MIATAPTLSQHLSRMQQPQYKKVTESKRICRAITPFIYLFIYLASPTRAGSPQQHMPITVGPLT
jgi:hypothetical protein